MQSLTFVCWKWKPAQAYRSKFAPSTVNILNRMLKRHYNAPFELVCVTDDPAGIDSDIRTIKLWDDFSNVPSPHGFGYPSCYRRLRMFSKEAVEMFGPRFVSIDLDVAITADITKLFDHNHDFKMYGDTAIGTPYNGSIIQLKAGTRAQVWETFDPRRSPMIGLRKKYIGSDQAWIAACLGPKEPKFTKADGVYSYRNEIAPSGGLLPSNAKIVIFHGRHDPWDPVMHRKYPWLAEAYR